MKQRFWCIALTCCLVLATGSELWADPISPEAAPAVNRAVAYIRGRAKGSAIQQLGEAALLALALEKADVPANDPDLGRLIGIVLAHFNGSEFFPSRKGGPDLYEASVAIMALANLDPGGYRGPINSAANYLLSYQKPNGSWDYTHRENGDTSISQYALLGLWEAENAGVKIPPEVWDRAGRWYLSTQRATGGWVYHDDEPLHTETVAMTAAGVGSLLLCIRQLEPYRKGNEEFNRLLTPLVPEGQRSTKYKPSLSNSEVTNASKRGIAWIASTFRPSTDPNQGNSVYYGLYGIERLGALADLKTLGGQDWFNTGLRYIISTQRSEGSWNDDYGQDAETAWAVLFMTKSTKKSVERIRVKKLGAGTLLGGKGLPKDLSQLTIAQGRVVVRPMNGAVDEMLSVLEDPRSTTADSALEGLLARYQKGGPALLRPHKDRLRALLQNKDPGVRALAVWALARTADIDVVPNLIGAITDTDDGVVSSAQIGLQLLSRKIDGLGPPIPSTPEQRLEAARKWREWYDAIRPPVLDGQDDLADSPLSLDLKDLKLNQ